MRALSAVAELLVLNFHSAVWLHEGTLNTRHRVVSFHKIVTLRINSFYFSWSFARCRLLSLCRTCTQLSASARTSGRGRQQPHYDSWRRPDGSQATPVASTPSRLQVVHENTPCLKTCELSFISGTMLLRYFTVRPIF